MDWRDLRRSASRLHLIIFGVSGSTSSLNLVECGVPLSLGLGTGGPGRIDSQSTPSLHGLAQSEVAVLHIELSARTEGPAAGNSGLKPGIEGAQAPVAKHMATSGLGGSMIAGVAFA